MTGNTEPAPKKTLTLGKKLDLKKTTDTDQVRQSFAHGRSKTVEVEVKRRRGLPVDEKTENPSPQATEDKEKGRSPSDQQVRLTDKELATRLDALKKAKKREAIEAQEKVKKQTQDESSPQEKNDGALTPAGDFYDNVLPPPTAETRKHPPRRDSAHDEETEGKGDILNREDLRRATPPTLKKDSHQPRKLSRHSITRALEDETEERRRSMASMRRARQKFKQTKSHALEQGHISREVVVADFITVSELANRMAVRAPEVIKVLMKMGMMVTINQVIDADTAELVCAEFSHKIKRVSDADVEIGIKGEADDPQDLLPRAPIVTIMGHVDHGKTSLLDALRKTNVVSGEAGGITQHIGAYQVHMKSGAKITFIDTPGHAAFTEMRARGANITDIVVLVVAADDGIKEQTIEAINHAQAAKVPIVVAINKIDKPDADPTRVRSELLNHGIVLEEFGGEVLAVEISAKKGLNLEKLEETILLQAEILNLTANPNRSAEGAVIESKIDKGRGVVATILVQRGTLKLGDIFVAGKESGRVRALINDLGQKVDQATPSMPIEVLGFNGVPLAGDEIFVVPDESRSRDITAYRQRLERDIRTTAHSRGSIENLMSQITAGEIREVPVVIKSDVQGSLEAIVNSLKRLSTDEVSVRVLHGGVGAISEGDVTLASASKGLIIGFNVRANAQALDLARRNQVNIRYYSIIYNIIDDVKDIMGGLLAPTLHEKYLGSAEIRQVFTITKVGKIAGCYVRDGIVKRGASVRLLRDNIVIHEGTLKTLKRFKEEVREAKESYECGMAFENYNDIQPGDIIECFEIEAQSRVL